MKSKELIVSAFFYIALASVFFFPFFQDKVLIYKDNLLHIAPMASFWKREILQLRLPLWNPNIFAGIPFLADPAHAVFSPLNLVYLLFNNLLRAVTFQAFILVSLASLGAYFLGRSLNLNQRSSLLAGLFFGFSGSLMEAVNDVNSLAAIALMPWVLAVFFEEVFEKKRYFSPKLSLLIALQLVSGHTQYSYYTLFLLGTIFLIKVKKKTPLFIATVVLGLSLVAIQLVPTLELVELSQRQQALSLSTERRLELTALPRVLFPKLYGSLMEGNSWGPGSQQESGLADVYGFISLSGLGLAVWGIFKFWQSQQVRFLTIVILISLFLSFGSQTPLYTSFQKFIPGFRLFRSPYRILSVYSLAVAILAGISFDKLVRLKLLKKFKLRLTPLVLLGIGLGIAVLGLLFRPNLISPFFTSFYQVLKGASLIGSQAYSIEKINQISVLIFQSLVISSVGLLSLTLLIFYLASRKIWFFVLAVLLIAVELFLGIRGNFFFADLKSIQVNKEVTTFLRSNPDGQRYISTSDTQPYTGIWVYFNHLVARPPFSREQVADEELENWNYLKKQLEMLPVNTNQYYDLKSANGYTALLPSTYRDWADSTNLNSLDYKTYKHKALNDLGAKYFITGVPTDFLSQDISGRFAKVFDSDDISVYENKDVEPRVNFFVNGKAFPANLEIVEEKSGKIVLNTEASQGGLLVLRDFNYPGWWITVDGKQRRINSFEGIFRASEIESGKHHIVFRYIPLSFVLGSAISLLSFGYLVIYITKRKKLL